MAYPSEQTFGPQVRCAPQRSLLKAMGYTDFELKDRPLIGIASSWNTISVTPAECMVGRKRLFTASSAKAEVSSTHMSRRSIFAFQYFTIEDMAPRICSDTAGLLQADRQTISSITFVITGTDV